MSQHSWTGQQGDISCPAAFSLTRETVSELGAHQVFDERLAQDYNHQMFGRTAQVFDTMSNHAYPPQDHPSYHQLTHTSTYPPPYYHSDPYLPPYYPPYHTAEHASLLFDSKPTEMIQSCAIQRATAAPNFQVQASASAMDCQKIPSVYATYNEDDCLTKSEQKPHHDTETQSIGDMLAHIQAKLKTMSENLSQDLKRMKSWESKQTASSQPNPSIQEAINMSDEMPVYDVYEDVTACRSRIHPTVDIIEPEQVEVKEDNGNPRISPERPTNEKKPDNEGIFLCVNKASYNTFGEEAADFIFSHGPVIHADRSIKLTNEKSSQAAHMLFVQGATVHCTDESSEINIKKHDIIKKPDVLIKKHDITSPCDLNNDKEAPIVAPIVLKYQLPLSSTTNTWDPGIASLYYPKLHTLPGIQRDAIVPVQHQIQSKSIISLWEFSFGKAAQMQWDPGKDNKNFNDLIPACWRTMSTNVVIKLTNGKPIQTASILSVQQGKLQKAHIKQWHMLLLATGKDEWKSGLYKGMKMVIASGTFIQDDVLAVRIQFDVPKCCVRQQSYCRMRSRLINHGLHFLWDPGIAKSRDMTLDIFVIPCQLLPIQKIPQLLSLILQTQSHFDLQQDSIHLPVREKSKQSPYLDMQPNGGQQFSCPEILTCCLYGSSFKKKKRKWLD